MQNIILCILVFLLSSCVATTYTPVNSVAPDQKQNTFFSQEVIYRVNDELFRQAPDCAIIWPTYDPKMPNVEAAVARYASEKLSRVIAPKVRERNARKWALDLRSRKDRLAFSEKVNCPFGISITTAKHNRDYFVVWSQQSLLLSLALRSVQKNETLWAAHHTAKRSGGGIPLSPVSAAINAAKARLHQADDDVAQSLVDDALRRMIVTLPDLS